MAKLTARGYYEVARWTKEGMTLVLRSDGKLLLKIRARGTYSTHGRARKDGVTLTPAAARRLTRQDWNDLVEVLTENLMKGGWMPATKCNSTAYLGAHHQNALAWKYRTMRERAERKAAERKYLEQGD